MLLCLSGNFASILIGVNEFQSNLQSQNNRKDTFLIVSILAYYHIS